jgi:hypothetical protein
LLFCRLKINHKAHGSYAFILEDSANKHKEENTSIRNSTLASGAAYQNKKHSSRFRSSASASEIAQTTGTANQE